MIVYEDYHFGEQQEISLFHIQDFSHFAHLHRSFELLRLQKGGLKACVDEREFIMEPGDMILILPYEVHSYTNLGQAECQVNVFSPDYIQEFYKMIPKKALNRPVFRLDDQMFSHMEKHLFLDSSKPLFSKSCLYYIAAMLLEESGLSMRKAPSSDLLHQILLYIQDHYLEDLTLQDLAVHLGYNRLYISRFINSRLGLSFTDLVNQHRINYSTHLLRTTDTPVSDIAFACGYNSLRSFNRCFKEIHHLTPREYRNQ